MGDSKQKAFTKGYGKGYTEGFGEGFKAGFDLAMEKSMLLLSGLTSFDDFDDICDDWDDDPLGGYYDEDEEFGEGETLSERHDE